MRTSAFTALPRIADRVILRRFAAADLAAFQAYRRDEAVGRYQGWSATTDLEALAFIGEMGTADLFASGRWIQLAVADRRTDTLIGDIGACVAIDGASVELGFTMSPRAQGRGLATDAVREAIALAFEQTAVDRVLCITDARNAPSIRLLERIGMHRSATAEADFRGERCIEHRYALDRPMRP